MINIGDHEEVSETNSKSKVPMLARYVRIHHAHNQIIGDKLDRTMTRNKLKGTCFLIKLELRTIKDSLDNES